MAVRDKNPTFLSPVISTILDASALILFPQLVTKRWGDVVDAVSMAEEKAGQSTFAEDTQLKIQANGRYLT